MNVAFIGGTGRCGTTITRKLLSQHPEVATLPLEYRFTVDPDGILDFYCSYTASWSPYLADRRLKRLHKLLRRLTTTSPFHSLLRKIAKKADRNGRFLGGQQYASVSLEQHVPRFQDHAERLISTLRDFTFPARWLGTESYAISPKLWHAGSKTRQDLAPVLGSFLRRVIEDLLDRSGRSFYVEDNTWNILFSRELLELVPEAKLIHVYRDPRDVVTSFTHQRWCPAKPRQAAFFYKSLMEHWLSVKETVPRSSLHEVSLEALVTDTENVLRGLCGFLGLAFDPSLLDIDLSKSHAGRWRHELSEQDKRDIHGILHGLIDMLGYDTDSFTGRGSAAAGC